MYCEDCEKRNECTQICDELEAHLRKDIEVGRIQLSFTDLGIEENIKTNSPWQTTVDYYDLIRAQERFNFSDKIFNILYTYYIEGKNQPKTAKEYNVSKQYVNELLKKYEIIAKNIK